DIVCAASLSAQAATDAARRANAALTPAPTKAEAPAAPVFGQRITPEGAEGHFYNTVTLPHTGGDTFSVRAYKLDSSEARTTTVVEVREIVTWRRVYYDFFAANAACEALYERIKVRLSEYYAPAFIELVENRKGDVTDTPITLVALNTLFGGKPALDHDPCHLRLGLVSQWGRKKSVTFELPAVDTERGVDAAATVTASHDVGTDQWSFRVRLGQRSVWPAAAWLTSFKVFQQTPQGGDAEIVRDGAEIGALSADVVGGADDATVTILSASVNAALTAAVRPCRVQIKVTYNQLLGGSSGGQNIALTRQALFDVDGTDEADRSVLIAFLHEIGHSLGVADVASPAYYFDDQGGRGPHCSTRTDLVDLAAGQWNEIPRDQTSSGQVRLPEVGGAGQCVMYHSRWTNMKDAVFCQDCVDVMKKMRIRVR
ncbi:MAG: hypothetical protein ABI134_00305, partial [Byssovorax sp.]